jgi:hypothetical protein
MVERPTDDELFREQQLDRDARARREIARAAGVALINLTAPLEAGLGVYDGAGPVTMALVGFAARARRLLRSAYRLIDEDERDSAAPLFRVMNEYLIVGRWLLAVGDEELKLWALDDLRSRITTLRDVVTDANLDDDTKASITSEIASTEEAIRRYGGEETPVTKRAARKAGYEAPSLETMAEVAGLSLIYAYPYRLLSQSDVHATPVAIDSAFDRDDDGVKVRPIPRFALEGYDSYLVGAHLLLDILRPLAERIPELGWTTTTNLVGETLAGISRADPESTRGMEADQSEEKTDSADTARSSTSEG